MKYLKIHDAFVFFIEETFVIFYWIGIWSLLHLTNLPKQLWFCFLCLVFSAFGMFFIRVSRPQVVVSVPSSRREFMHTIKTNPKMLKFESTTKDDNNKRRQQK
jgi:hypothetical protein